MFGKRKIKELEAKVVTLEERIEALEKKGKSPLMSAKTENRGGELSLAGIYDEWFNGERKDNGK